MPAATGAADNWHGMTDFAERRQRLRILLSEGSSTSAREAITALGLAGHHIEVCDPDPRCLGRFSRFVAKFHRCPGLKNDPQAYLSFVRDLLIQQRFDVLLPIHEQGFLFAKVAPQLSSCVGIALPSFESYRRAHNKVEFSHLLDELALPQPATHIVRSAAALRAAAVIPGVIKTAIGTASRGTWVVRSSAQVESTLAALSTDDFEDGVLVQEFVAGPVEHAQAVFARGDLVAFHAYRQLAVGAGGGDARKASVRRPEVRDHVARIGAHLAWHGALSFDYILRAGDSGPVYIDCNPRLVEPMSACLAGLDLADILVQVSFGKFPATAPEAPENLRTHLAMQALLGCAQQTGARRQLLMECWRLLTGRGPYRGSREELTPVASDWLSAIPLAATALLLLLRPKWAFTLPKTGWGGHLLDARTVKLIAQADFSATSVP